MRPTFGDVFTFDKTGIPGVVVYIHPQRRFYSIEFDMGRGRHCRESFYFPARSGPERYKK